MTEARRTGPALETMYRFLLWLVPAVDKFPRSVPFGASNMPTTKPIPPRWGNPFQVTHFPTATKLTIILLISHVRP